MASENMTKRKQSILTIPDLLQLFAIFLAKVRRVLSGSRDYMKDVNQKLIEGIDYIYQSMVSGDVAEFGTMTGRTAMVISRAISKREIYFGIQFEKPRKIFLFDSFVGLPKISSAVDRESPHVRSGVWGLEGCKGITKEKLFKKINKYLSKDRILIFDGWFKDTLIKIPPGTKFSYVHIDSDLYQSAIEVLDYLFSNLHISEGAMIFFDDYNCNSASPDYGERKAWNETIEKYSIKYSDCGSYSWGGWKFIVHEYNAKK